MSNQDELHDGAVVRAAVMKLLDVKSKVDTILEACRIARFPVDYWVDVVTDEDGSVRGYCENQQMIPPFELYDDDGEFLSGPFWSWEDAKIQALHENANGKYQYIEVQNFAGNSCATVVKWEKIPDAED